MDLPKTSLIEKHALIIVSILLFSGVSIVVFHMTNLAKRLAEQATLSHAEHYTDALRAFRTLYTSEVVERVRNEGINVSHDYMHHKKTIPLPATLTKALGESLGKNTTSDSQVLLYSKYPFPHQVNRLEPGNFESAAWQQLINQPETPFYRFTTYEGKTVLRYATADRMRESCIDCHNTHPKTPKSGWEVGDVRGVLEVILPVNTKDIVKKSGIASTAVYMIFITLLSVTVIGITLNKIKKLNHISRHGE